jgi:hypothetical protein
LGHLLERGFGKAKPVQDLFLGIGLPVGDSLSIAEKQDNDDYDEPALLMAEACLL